MTSRSSQTVYDTHSNLYDLFQAQLDQASYEGCFFFALDAHEIRVKLKGDSVDEYDSN